ncbi:MAG: ATP-binding protein [Deltaproteobacteria bacterium]|nr:ATP-binding protein [Deltaproteobacteria bacterium]MCW5806767.1 ATP-binding protein [Deltaproteobacteria bacterium]
MAVTGGNGRRNRRFIRGISSEVLLGSVSKRIYQAALAQGRSQEQVPALAELAPLAEIGIKLTPEQQSEIIGTHKTMFMLFGTDQIAFDLMLFTIALELDERVYMAAMNLTASGINAPGPRIGGVLSLLYPNLHERSLAHKALLEDSPLQVFRLVRLLSATKGAPTSQRELCADSSMLAHIIRDDAVPALPPELAGCGALYGPADLDVLDGSLDDELGHKLELLIADQGLTRALHIHLSAARTAPSIARRIAARLHRPVIVLDLRAVEKDHDEKVTLTLREARLRNGFAFFLNPMSMSDEEYSSNLIRQHAQKWRRMLAHETKFVILASEDPETRDVDTLPGVGIDLTVYAPEASTVARRRELFQIALYDVCKDQPGGVPQLSVARDVSVDYLASVYRVDEAEVKAIVSSAATEARLKALTKQGEPVIELDTLRRSAREKTHRDVGKFAKLVRSSYTWEDLVLPSETTSMLQDFLGSARRRMFVYDEWGFAKKHKRGLSLCAVFYGASGTGKTMSAEVMANDLGVNMYQVDLSAVISKWLGETERHLGQIFDATENSDSILFFDEADAIFGKRTEVQESKDRYANVEVSYLLQRIEQYNGIVILSTNLRTNMDEAFLRRLHFGIDFAMPDYDGRLQIWSRSFPQQTPLRGVSLEKLASEYDEISGGQIKLIAMGAAMLAAADRTEVTMDCIERAYVNELIKMQRVVWVENGKVTRRTS